jgi:hypothetical protein
MSAMLAGDGVVEKQQRAIATDVAAEAEKVCAADKECDSIPAVQSF